MRGSIHLSGAGAVSAVGMRCCFSTWELLGVRRREPRVELYVLDSCLYENKR